MGALRRKPTSLLNTKVADGKYQLVSLLGWNGNKVIFLGADLSEYSSVVINLESVYVQKPKLANEIKLFKELDAGVGVPKIYWNGIEGDFQISV